MSQPKQASGRRSFLVGLATGAGAVAALSTVPEKAVATKKPTADPGPPVIRLYSRTEETERYYRTLYR
jgi:hypothetical protein